MLRRFKALPKFGKIAIIIGVAATWLTIGASSNQQPTAVHLLTTTDTGVLGAQTTAVANPVATPSITSKTVTETQAIPFTTTIVTSTSVPQGTTKITTPGVNGVATLTYKLTYSAGVQTAKDLVGRITTTQPVNQVTTVGTYLAPKPVAVAPPATPSPAPAAAASSCDPNYAGACVPIASDVDCAGGGGNGPAFVQGPVRVIGTDIYRLDSDGNGTGCEN